jgi:hypothetical protein
MATWGTARVRGAGGPARPRPARRAQCCSTSRRRRGAGVREAAEEQRLTSTGTAEGGAVSMSGRNGGAVDEEKVRTRGGQRGNGWDGEVVGTAAQSAGRRSGAARSAGRGSCRDARRAVPTAALSRAVGAARGSHGAAAHCRAGLARHVAADRWGPLPVIVELKIHPEGN